MKNPTQVMSLATVHMMVSAQFISNLILVCVQRKEEQKKRLREEAMKRRGKTRIKFSAFIQSISEKDFRRIFECHRIALGCCAEV